mmetsp:Transcript_32837/g.53279  ORF Transcript_32837/g.53279 Transcript_32837/m.53279 type:complete len:142 (-) Transcript_32837:17-442(-)|eukprot:CAMPEP_0184652550 /NCGR_PEP_ID=MMETSP0308-20130426/10254_1 /TAXON_ID=38269 /ORGANISM="Gloeochaete witrockiana, Strain SAG 46.84" /LENGTH=141 /DNA_ID=CAMNT_0027087491 /DNA_START=54 /DNA_END=479 /DNA_ORIENTATION=+
MPEDSPVAAPAAAKAPAKKVVVQKKKAVKVAPFIFSIDVSKPAADGVLDPAEFARFLSKKIKVNGKAGVLREKITVKAQDQTVIVTAVPPFSKRYLKYLTKKFLKKKNLRDWLHVVATTKDAYALRYYKIQEEEEGEEAQE